MKLHTLTGIVTTKKKRMGLGHGSGRSKTAGRGTKGQKARGKVPMYRYSGGSLSFVKSLPFLRGKQRNKGWKPKSVIISVERLQILPKDTVVDMKALIGCNLVSQKDAKAYGVKILGNGNLTTPLNIQVPISKGAAQIVVKAGGIIQTENE